MAAKNIVGDVMIDAKTSAIATYLQGSKEAFAWGADGNLPGFRAEPDGSVTEGVNTAQTKMRCSKGSLEAQLICCLGHLHCRRYLDGRLVNDLPGCFSRYGPE